MINWCIPFSSVKDLDCRSGFSRNAVVAIQVDGQRAGGLSYFQFYIYICGGYLHLIHNSENTPRKDCCKYHLVY